MPSDNTLRATRPEGAAVAEATAAAAPISERERTEREYYAQRYQTCVDTANFVKGLLPTGGQLGDTVRAQLPAALDWRLPSVHHGCQAYTVTIGFVRRMLPGGGRSGGRKLLSFGVSVDWEMLYEYLHRWVLQLDPYRGGGASGGRRLLGADRSWLLPSYGRCRVPREAGVGSKGAALLACLITPPTGGRSGGRRRPAPPARRVQSQKLGARKYVRGKGTA
jgi:hypothetical protein